MQTKEEHNMSYCEYMEGMIDKLINDNSNTVMSSASSVVLPPPSVTPPPLASHLNDLVVVSKQDINAPSKKFGFLAHNEPEFTFIGPDRRPTPLDNLNSYIIAANIIKETGLPNYRMARFPIQCGLNIEALCRYLTDYPSHMASRFLLPTLMTYVIIIYQNKCLRKILKIRWEDHISNKEINERSGIKTASQETCRRRWKFIGHMLRKDPENDCNIALSWAPEGRRKRGRPKATWPRTVEVERKALGYNTWAEARVAAANKDRWRCSVEALCATRHQEDR